MKNLLKIGALSLALMAAVFMLNTNAQTTTDAAGDAKLEITTKTGKCYYGTSVNLGITGYSTTDITVSTGFTALDADSNNTGNWYCVDTEGDQTFELTLQATTNLIHTGNTAVFITGIRISNDATVVSQNFVAGTDDCEAEDIVRDEIWIADTTSVIIIKKDNDPANLGKVCTITATNVVIGVDIPAYQGVGVYTGDLELTLTSTFGNNIMN